MKEELDILFLAGLFPKEKENEILKNSKGSIQNAANVFQWNIVRGLDSNLKKPIKVLNSLYIGSFPFRYKKLIIKSYKFKHFETANNYDDYNVGFINLMGFKIFSKLISTRHYVKKWALDGKNNKVIIAYALTSNNLKIFKYLKAINKDIKTCIVIPDLPEYMNTTNKTKFIYNIFKKLDIKSINKLLKYSDSFVILTKYMKEKLTLEDKPYVVIEGICEIDNKFNKEYLNNSLPNENKKIILYTGTLNEKYGVIDLVNAFENIGNENYKLIFCGDGDSKNKIIEASEKDNRIILKGILPREDILKLQKEATVLINPRKDDNEFCKYSFPSKLLEYLSSGVPVIAYKLRGIPDEYDNYINYIEDDSNEALTNKILQICEEKYYESKKRAEDGRSFIINKKNYKFQGEKILSMINKLFILK